MTQQNLDFGTPAPNDGEFAPTAFLKIQENFDELYDSVAADEAALAAHLSDATAAHAASAISYGGGAGMSATDVEAAIDELATEKANISLDNASVVNFAQTGYHDLTEMAAPSSPASNVARLYSVDDGGTTKLAVKDSAGVVNDLTHFTRTGTGTGLRTQSGKLEDIPDLRDWLVATGTGTDQTAKVQNALTDMATYTGPIRMPPGNIRIDGQLTFDGNNVDFVGDGLGTTLDFRYAGGHCFIIGNGSVRREKIAFRNFSITQANGGNVYCFESRFVRDLTFDGIRPSAFYGFAKLGRSGEITSHVMFKGMEGNHRSTHEHFVDAVNVSGSLWFADWGHIEGNSGAIIDGTCFLNIGTTATRPDGAWIDPGWVGRRYSRGINIRPGCANFVIKGPTFDQIKHFPIYADTDVGAIAKLEIDGGIYDIEGANSSTTCVYIARTTNSATGVSVKGALGSRSGAEGFHLTGDMAVVFEGNRALDCCQQADNTYAAFRLGASLKGVVANNLSEATAANQPNYGFLNDSTSNDLLFCDKTNLSIGHVTGKISGWAGARRFKAHKNGTNQTGVAADTTTVVTFGTEAVDIGAIFASNAVVPPTGRPFYMEAYVRVNTTNVVDQQRFYIGIYADGVLYARGPDVQSSGTGGLGLYVSAFIPAPNGTSAYDVRAVLGAAASGDKTIDGTAEHTRFSGWQL